jgi:hypothetical protein
MEILQKLVPIDIGLPVCAELQLDCDVAILGMPYEVDSSPTTFAWIFALRWKRSTFPSAFVDVGLGRPTRRNPR